jgi:hypothetical protein
MRIYQSPDLEVILIAPQVGFAGSIEVEEPGSMNYGNGGDAW